MNSDLCFVAKNIDFLINNALNYYFIENFEANSWKIVQQWPNLPFYDRASLSHFGAIQQISERDDDS